MPTSTPPQIKHTHAQKTNSKYKLTSLLFSCFLDIWGYGAPIGTRGIFRHEKIKKIGAAGTV